MQVLDGDSLMTDWEVIVVGAGAAGLLAATRAAERGRKTLLIEKNRKPGVKILMSGGTRCNLTQNTDARGIVAAFGDQGSFLHSALARLGPAELVALVEAEGVPTKVEPTGKIFPRSDKAADVLAALQRRLAQSGCTLAPGQPVHAVQRHGGRFELTTSVATLTADRVIITTGGQSYPGCGTTGDGYGWARQLGHSIVPPRPALVPITTNATWVHALKGITVADVAVRIVNPCPPTCDCTQRDSSGGGTCSSVARPAARLQAHHRDSFLFTHFGVSGPAVLDISREVTGHPEPQSLLLECDFWPELSDPELDRELRRRAADEGKRPASAVLADKLPRRLVEALLAEAHVPRQQRAAELGHAGRIALVNAVKHCRIPISGTRGFAKAEVTAGGIALCDVDSRTMQSKLVGGLYLAGEVLDLDGRIGGYNFQAAFSTGWLAGESV